VKFLIDAQLPPVLAQAMTDAGCEAVASREVGLRDAADSTIWEYALHQSFIVITKDEDFPMRALQNPNSPIIVWIRIGNCTN
jgi:predicted nuclease of predicted toxin-antitoxin system